MADPRLRWSQVAAPDLTGASRILANANQSFNNAFDTADSVLARYAEGQQEKADNELLTEIASISDEAKLGEFLNSGALQGRNISSAMRDRVLGLRDTVLGYGKDRATTAYTQAGTRSLDGRLAIAQALEGRNAAEYDYKTNARNELAGLSGAVVAANLEGNRYGSQGIPQNQRQSYIYEGLLKRGLPEHVAQGFMMNFEDESGFDPGINEKKPLVPGSRGGFGLYQLTGPRRVAYERFAQATGRPVDDVDAQLDFMMQELTTSERGAFNEISKASNAGEAGAAIVSRFLRPAEEHRNSRSQRYLSSGGYNPQRSATPSVDALSAALANSQYQTPATVQGLLGDAYGAQKAGDARLKSQGEEVSNEISSQLILDALMDPQIVTEQALTNRLAQDNPNLTATERLATIRRGQGLAQGTPGLLSPSVLPDLEVDTAIELANQNIDSQLRSTPQNRMIGDISNYREDPTGALVQELGLGKDGENPGFISGLLFGESGFDQNRLKNLINDYARQLNVTPEVAAVAMREAFVRDPFTLVNNQNTLENRFPIDRVQEIVEGNLSLDQQRLYRRERGVADQSKAQVQRLNNALQVLMARQAKGEQGLEEQIATLRKSILEFETSNPINAGR